MSAAAITPLPSQSKVEQLAQEYLDIDAQIEAKEKDFAATVAPLAIRRNELKQILIEDVQRWGSAHAKKSKIVYGTTLEVMCTFGSFSSTDGQAVEAFRLGLKKSGQTRLLKQIFAPTIRWDLKAGASKVIDVAHEAGKLPAKLFVLYSRCTVTKDSTPRIEVRPRSA
jgi:hypothetical protein